MSFTPYSIYLLPKQKKILQIHQTKQIPSIPKYRWQVVDVFAIGALLCAVFLKSTVAYEHSYVYTHIFIRIPDLFLNKECGNICIFRARLKLSTIYKNVEELIGYSDKLCTSNQIEVKITMQITWYEYYMMRVPIRFQSIVSLYLAYSFVSLWLVQQFQFKVCSLISFAYTQQW